MRGGCQARHLASYANASPPCCTPETKTAPMSTLTKRKNEKKRKIAFKYKKLNKSIQNNLLLKTPLRLYFKCLLKVVEILPNFFVSKAI